MFDAQQALSKISIEQERYRLAKQRQEQQPAAPAAETTHSQVQASAAPQATAPDPKAEKWAEKNEWFGDDEIMTQAAFVIHNNLREEGFDGTEDEYYTQLDTRLKERFPKSLDQNKTREVQGSPPLQLPHLAVQNRGAGLSSCHRHRWLLLKNLVFL